MTSCKMKAGTSSLTSENCCIFTRNFIFCYFTLFLAPAAIKKSFVKEDYSGEEAVVEHFRSI